MCEIQFVQLIMPRRGGEGWCWWWWWWRRRRFMTGWWRRENIPGKKRDDGLLFKKYINWKNKSERVKRKEKWRSEWWSPVRSCLGPPLCPCRCESILSINHLLITAALPAHNEKVKRPNIAPVVLQENHDRASACGIIPNTVLKCSPGALLVKADGGQRLLI